MVEDEYDTEKVLVPDVDPRIQPSVSQSRQVYIWLPLPAYTTMPFADLYCACDWLIGYT